MSLGIHYRHVTPERLACLRAVFAAGGRIDHDDQSLAPFCDDRSTLTTPDVFNQCHDAGWLQSSHDNRTDTSVAWLTETGREVVLSQ